MLSLGYMDTTHYNATSYFRSNTYKNYIKTVAFVDYIDTSNVSINAEGNKIMWDMTTNTNVNKNKVIAWLEDDGTTDDNGNNKYYNLYIGSKEKIYGKSLLSFFSDMTALKNINFDNLDTKLTTLMSMDAEYSYGGMFQNCSSLTSLDLQQLRVN